MRKLVLRFAMDESLLDVDVTGLDLTFPPSSGDVDLSDSNDLRRPRISSVG
jgi:hypothetical protein